MRMTLLSLHIMAETPHRDYIKKLKIENIVTICPKQDYIYVSFPWRVLGTALKMATNVDKQC